MNKHLDHCYYIRNLCSTLKISLQSTITNQCKGHDCFNCPAFMGYDDTGYMSLCQIAEIIKSLDGIR